VVQIRFQPWSDRHQEDLYRWSCLGAENVRDGKGADVIVAVARGGDTAMGREAQSAVGPITADDAATIRLEWASTPPLRAKKPKNTSVNKATATAIVASLFKPK
jgi:hypothetical protein